MVVVAVVCVVVRTTLAARLTSRARFHDHRPPHHSPFFRRPRTGCVEGGVRGCVRTSSSSEQERRQQQAEEERSTTSTSTITNNITVCAFSHQQQERAAEPIPASLNEAGRGRTHQTKTTLPAGAPAVVLPVLFRLVSGSCGVR